MKTPAHARGKQMAKNRRFRFHISLSIGRCLYVNDCYNTSSYLLCFISSMRQAHQLNEQDLRAKWGHVSRPRLLEIPHNGELHPAASIWLSVSFALAGYLQVTGRGDGCAPPS